MARTKVFRRSSDARMTETWKPILEKHGADLEKTPWLAEYAHNHAIFENSGMSPIFEQTAPGLYFQQPASIGGYMGAAVAPTSSQTPFTSGGAKNSYASSGSGDKFPSLMPVAIQVAAKTIGFDLAPVIPMDSPVGFLPYLDYLYAGGRTDKNFDPYIIKLTGITANNFSGTLVAGNAVVGGGADGADFTAEFIGYSRIDGHVLIRIMSDASTGGDSTVAGGFEGGAVTIGGNVSTVSVAAGAVVLPSALENHISGFTSITTDENDASYGNNFQGPYLPATGTTPASMKRQVGELSKFRQMGLRMFTKFIEAETDQVAITATVEQIQDLNRVWNYDVISMLENIGVNEVAQTINKRLTDRIHTLADVHTDEVALVEGTGITTLDLATGTGGFENISTLQRRFVTKVLEMATLINHRGRFGPGTFLVASGRMSVALADVAGYSIAQAPSEMTGVPSSLTPAGKVYGVQVYADPNMAWGDTRVVIGRKGGDEEPGVKFMPYIMAESLQTISEGTMSPKIGIKSRYAITEAGWHPETQYVSMEINGDVAVLTGGVAPANFS